MKISPNPSFSKRGILFESCFGLPFAKGGQEGFGSQCLHNYGLIETIDGDEKGEVRTRMMGGKKCLIIIVGASNGGG